jgi:putative DNA primase/helicase
LAWQIEGCRMWQRDGLKPPAVVVEATEEYLAAEDVTGQWFDECCQRVPNVRESSKALWQSRRSWGENNRVATGSHNQLSEWLHGQGFTDCKLEEQRAFLGLQLRRRPRQ